MKKANISVQTNTCCSDDRLLCYIREHDSNLFFRSSQFSGLDMAQNGRLQNRAYSPYAVDSVEFQDLSKDPSSSYPNAAYQNLGLAKSQEDLSRNLSSFKGSYQNPAYENSEVAHQYEDPAHLVPPATSASTGPRRKRNELYEPTEIRKEDEEEDNEDYSDGIAGDSWLSRLILFLILMVSLAALLLVVLIILGKVGPSCSCSKEQGELGDLNCHI